MPKQTDMLIRGTDICEALATVAKVVSKEPAAICFRSKNGGLEIRAEKNGVAVAVMVNAESSINPVKFILPFDRMHSICAKRGVMNFQQDDNVLRYWVEGERYQGEVFIADFAPIEMVKSREAEEIDGSNLFNQYIPYVDLTAIDRQEMICFIVSENGKLELAAADNYHAVLLQTQTKMPDFKLTIPVKYQKILTAAFAKQSYTLTVENSVFFAANKQLVVQLPVFDSGGITFEQISEYIKENSKSTTTFEIDMPRFSSVLENMASVYEKNRRLEMKLKKNRLSFNMQSTYGKASDVITVDPMASDETPIYTDMSLLKDVAGKIAKFKGRISFIADRCVIFKAIDEEMALTYIVTALSKKD